MKSLLRCVLFALCTIPAAAQINGAVTGVVIDSTKAVVINAEVTLTLLDTGLVSRTLSNEAGVYRFASVRIGRYELRVTAPGFKSFVQQPIIVETSQTVRVDAQLELGATQESVT